MNDDLQKKEFAALVNLYPRFETIIFVAKYVIDLILIFASYWLSYLIRFEGAIPPDKLIIFKETLFVFVLCFFICDFLFGLARGVWRYASLQDIERIGFFVLAGNGLSILVGLVFLYNVVFAIPRSIYIINFFLLFLSLSAARLSYRIIFDKIHRLRKKQENILIVGDQNIAASLQYSILKDYNYQFKIVGFITFNKSRVSDTISAIPIIGTIDAVPALVAEKNIKYIFIAVDQASNEEMKRIIKISQGSGAFVRIVPSILDVVNGKFALKDLREIKFEDYLEREPVKFDTEKIKDTFYKKRILVTGGGGSIGSSICKELIKLNLEKLIVLDISETNLFKVSRELNALNEKANLKGVELVYKIMDVRDAVSLEKLFAQQPLDYVVHAAALKHVVLCEENPLEAISTNVYGTLNLINASLKEGIKKFIYISTDKAVEPTSVMGATKRIGELLIKWFSADSSVKTKFTAVRFGNVIGSSGNVVEIFTDQLQRKEKLTITDPEMTRYFMSLDEATKLILEAISLGKGGEIFVLDMGTPIKIKDLAYDIALFYGSHLKAHDFLYIGKKKGEKLSEKLFSAREKKVATNCNKIIKVEEEVSMKGLLEKINHLAENSYQYGEDEARQALFSIVKSAGSSV
jgi:FlaA1/EpsC-like NDP-sugar epimerase